MKPKFATMIPIMVLSILVIGIIIIPATSDSLAIKRDATTRGRTLDGVGGVGVVTIPPTVPPVVMPPSGGGLGAVVHLQVAVERYIYRRRYDCTSTSTCYHCWSRRSWWQRRRGWACWQQWSSWWCQYSIYMHR